MQREGKTYLDRTIICHKLQGRRRQISPQTQLQSGTAARPGVQGQSVDPWQVCVMTATATGGLCPLTARRMHHDARTPEAANSRNPMDGRAAVASVVFSGVAVQSRASVRPRRSVALQITRKHARKSRTNYAVKALSDQWAMTDSNWLPQVLTAQRLAKNYKPPVAQKAAQLMQKPT